MEHLVTHKALLEVQVRQLIAHSVVSRDFKFDGSGAIVPKVPKVSKSSCAIAIPKVPAEVRRQKHVRQDEAAPVEIPLVRITSVWVSAQTRLGY